MDLIVNKLLKQMEMKDWSEVEMMKMKLGLQVLIHDFLMISFILLLAKGLGIFTDSVILFIGYALLKITAGGIHFKKSSLCLLGTSAFIIAGVFIAKHITLSFGGISCIYFVCMAVLWIVAPQGTQNNPVFQEKYDKLKRCTILISGMYYLITIYEYLVGIKISSFLLVAIVFETLSLLPVCVFCRSRQNG
ncbi:MAG: accessory gene regulator B family protein [Clostridium sp.]|nr:accessory gene regulator B family protein [Clostridium sp.]